MAKNNDGRPREVRPQQPECDGNQFARNPYAQDESAYYDVSYTNVGEVPESRVFNPDGPFYQSGGKVGPGEGQFRSSATDMNTRSEQQLLKGYNVISNDEAQSGFVGQRSVHLVGPDQSSNGRAGDDGYSNTPSPERDRTHADFSRGGKR